MALSAFDHLRPTDDADCRDGVYRVVGVDETAATLLLVADEGGRRGHFGTVRRVSRERIAMEFEPADNPDDGIDPTAILKNAVDGLVWSVRTWLGR